MSQQTLAKSSGTMASALPGVIELPTEASAKRGTMQSREDKWGWRREFAN